MHELVSAETRVGALFVKWKPLPAKVQSVILSQPIPFQNLDIHITCDYDRMFIFTQ